MPKKIPYYQIVTVGSAVRDMTFYTNDAELIRNPKKDPTKARLIGFEYGAKIHSDTVCTLFGGGAANTAIACARLNLRVATLLRVGCDGVGDTIKRHLRAEGIAVKYIQFDDKRPTGFSFVVVETKTDEHVAFVNYGANEYLEISSDALRTFTTDWFYVPSLAMKRWPQVLRDIIRTGSKIAWNPGDMQLREPKRVQKFLPAIHTLIVNKDEAIALSLGTGYRDHGFSVATLAKHLFSLGAKLVVITNGRKGAYVYDGMKLYFKKPVADKPKDTTGAGDAFGATFIASLIYQAGDIEFALHLATVNASAQVAVVGAQEGLLTWSQIQQQLKRQK